MPGDKRYFVILPTWKQKINGKSTDSGTKFHAASPDPISAPVAGGTFPSERVFSHRVPVFPHGPRAVGPNAPRAEPAVARTPVNAAATDPRQADDRGGSRRLHQSISSRTPLEFLPSDGARVGRKCSLRPTGRRHSRRTERARGIRPRPPPCAAGAQGRGIAQPRFQQPPEPRHRAAPPHVNDPVPARSGGIYAAGQHARPDGWSPER